MNVFSAGFAPSLCLPPAPSLPAVPGPPTTGGPQWHGMRPSPLQQRCQRQMQLSRRPVLGQQGRAAGVAGPPPRASEQPPEQSASKVSTGPLHPRVHQLDVGYLPLGAVVVAPPAAAPPPLQQVVHLWRCMGVAPGKVRPRLPRKSSSTKHLAAAREGASGAGAAQPALQYRMRCRRGARSPAPHHTHPPTG